MALFDTHAHYDDSQFDPDREEPILCKAGEYIRFVPITIDDYYDIRRMIVKGTYKVETVEEDETCL